MSIDHHLATYGTLAPGKPNHHQLAALEGHWVKGRVRGHLVDKGWGAAMGYPALIPADDGDDVAVDLFCSADLPQHWGRLDGFEGLEYKRSAIKVHTDEGVVEAWIYLDAEAPSKK